MGDIGKFIPEESLTVQRIYGEYKKVGDTEPTRGYLGASIIGHPCERYLWYCFRQCCNDDISGRIYRLFETGNLEEARFAKDLWSIGCEVHDTDEQGEQFEVSALGGHFSGHMDGCALGIPEAPKTWHVLEFKTHNAKSFKKLQKDKVEKSKPKHYAQMQVYMHLTGMKRALYLAVNKDTDELYSERIRYDKLFCECLMERAERIITSSEPPERAFNRADYYECNWCDAKAICWGTVSPEPALPIKSFSCRQCCHATPCLGGNIALWNCRKSAASSGRLKPCEHYLLLPGLFSFAKPTDYGEDKEGCGWIEFTNEDGTKWKHGSTVGCYNTEELMVLPADKLSDEILTTAKDLFGATATDCGLNILIRYPEGDCRIVWKGPVSELFDMWWKCYDEDLAKLKPLATCDFDDFRAAELNGGRVAIVWKDEQKAEIRQGVE
jgi:hypothetical protein